LSDRAISSVGIAAMSVPQYWLGTSLVIIFAVQFGMLPATGMGNPSADSFSTQMSYMLLPMITLSVSHIGVIARSVRSTVGEILQQDFIEALYAKGLTPTRVFIHVAKTAAPPILAIIGLQVANLLGGSILVETVFAWPGTGSLLNSAIFMRDLPLLQGTILVLAMFFVFTNLLVDVMQMALDPRMKNARAGANR
jgi:peptide/nickel transport system permease protein